MCGVKKRVERSCEDPTIVVTTYEGQHTHPSPAGPRGSTPSLPIDHSYPMTFTTGSAAAAAGAFSLPSTSQQQAFLPSLPHHSYLLNLPSSVTVSNSTPPGFCSTSTASLLIRDFGLLQDMVNPDAKRE